MKTLAKKKLPAQAQLGYFNGEPALTIKAFADLRRTTVLETSQQYATYIDARNRGEASRLERLEETRQEKAAKRTPALASFSERKGMAGKIRFASETQSPRQDERKGFENAIAKLLPEKEPVQSPSNKRQPERKGFANKIATMMSQGKPVQSPSPQRQPERKGVRKGFANKISELMNRTK